MGCGPEVISLDTTIGREEHGSNHCGNHGESHATVFFSQRWPILLAVLNTSLVYVIWTGHQWKLSSASGWKHIGLRASRWDTEHS